MRPEWKKENELISVIIPVHNRADMIKRCVASVQKQSYTDTEIIVVDDHSTDGTTGAVLSLAEGDTRPSRTLAVPSPPTIPPVHTSRIASGLYSSIKLGGQPPGHGL